MAKDKYEKLSQGGREAIAQGFNPRSLSDEDYAEYVKAHRGTDPTRSPVDGEADVEPESDEGEDEGEGEE